MAKCNAIKTTLDRATSFADSAKTSLAVFPDSPLRRALIEVSDYAVNRAR
jgi:octaprenyl-diphosphate synthase